MSVIIENFDTSDDTYDPAFFKLVAEQTLNIIEFPVINIDVSDKVNAVSSRFQGEIKNSDKFALRSLLSNTTNEMLDDINARFVREVTSFKSEITKLKNTFSEKLLETINGDLDKLIEQFKNKELEIHTYEDLLAIISKIDNA